MGFREKLREQVKATGISQRELSLRAGLSYSYVCKLLSNGPGNRDNPSPEVIDKLAMALGLAPSDLSDDDRTLSQTLLDELYEMTKDDRQSLRMMTTRSRLMLVISILEQDGRWGTRSEMSAVLGLPEDTYRAILDGVEPEGATIHALAENTGLKQRFWVRGRLDPHPRLISQVLERDDAVELLDLMVLVAENKVSASTIRNIVMAVAKGGAN